MECLVFDRGALKAFDARYPTVVARSVRRWAMAEESPTNGAPLTDESRTKRIFCPSIGRFGYSEFRS